MTFLTGRVAVVTGASSGLGRATALRLADAGAAVAVNYSTSMKQAQETVAMIEERGGTATAVQADVSNGEQVGAMVDAVEAWLGSPDVLVANSAVTKYAPFESLEELDVALWRHILGVNLIGAFLCAQAVAPRMRTRGFGRIVFVSSNSAYTADGSSIPYVVSKAGVISLTQCLSRALAPTVLVNAVAPGWMRTNWVDRYIPAHAAAYIMAESNDRSVDPDEVAQAIVAVACNPGITGQTLVVDRGDMWLK